MKSVTKETKSTSGGVQKSPLKTISLKAALQGGQDLGSTKQKQAKEEKKEEIKIDPSWNTPVSEESVKRAWLKYAKQVEANNLRLTSIMNNHIPQLQDGHVLSVELKNVTQEKELQAEKTTIFTFLKVELKNASLELKTSLMQGEQKHTKAFTAADKAKLMAKKNPALLLLTKKFDLDVE